LLAHLYSNGPNALSAVKQLIPVSAKAALDDAIMEETSRRIAEIRATPEAQEGLSAFLEKRKPAWVEPPVKRVSGARKKRTAK
jgi:methylglutaconyl-CoA hydratase